MTLKEKRKLAALKLVFTGSLRLQGMAFADLEVARQDRSNHDVLDKAEAEWGRRLRQYWAAAEEYFDAKGYI